MTAFYNEIDPYAAQWLRNLIAAGHIAPGVVDERSIEDIFPDELHAYTQCHFFAGIGVWSHALRLAGWPDDRPCWTGSCPCQPFSAAGKGGGFVDERHLWPGWNHLIGERRPPVIFGEQVASKNAGEWLDLVQDDLEGLGYAFGAIPFPSAGIGAPHIRDRLYWVADATAIGSSTGSRYACVSDRTVEPQRSGGLVRLADDDDEGLEGRARTTRSRDERAAGSRGVACGGLADCGCLGRKRWQDASRSITQDAPIGGESLCDVEPQCRALGMADDDDDAGLGRFAGLRLQRPDLHDADGRRVLSGFWADADWVPCRDNRWRPVESGAFPLAHGVANRVGRLRAYGNAVNAQAARVWIETYMGL